MVCGSGGSKSRLAKVTGADPCGHIRDEKLRVVEVRSTFPSQNVQKNTNIGPLLEVEMSKKCTPLLCEAHFEVKSVKKLRVRSTFGRSDVVSRGRRTLSKVSKTWRPWRLCSSFNYYTSLHYTTLHYTTTRTTTTTKTTLHYTTLRYLHCTTLINYITNHYSTLHYTTLHHATTATTTTLRYTTRY